MQEFFNFGTMYGGSFCIFREGFANLRVLVELAVGCMMWAFPIICRRIVRTVIWFRRFFVMGEVQFELFFRQHEGRVWHQIRRLGVSADWYDEFYAEGIVALWEAYRSYDHQRGDVGTYLNYRIRYRLIDLLRRKLREVERVEKVVEQKGEELHAGNFHRASGMPLVDARGIEVGDDQFWERVRSRLSEKQWKWVKYFIIADLSVKEIMELEGVSADAVKGWGREVRRKLKDEPLWEWLGK